MQNGFFLVQKKEDKVVQIGGMSVMFLAFASIKLVVLTVAVLTKPFYTLHFTPVRNQVGRVFKLTITLAFIWLNCVNSGICAVDNSGTTYITEFLNKLYALLLALQVF